MISGDIIRKEQVISEHKQKKQILCAVEVFLSEGNYKQAECILKKHFTDQEQDLDWASAWSILHFNKGNVESAIEILENVYYKYEYNIELNYNLAFYHAYIENYDSAVIYCSRTITIDKEQNYVQLAADLIEKMPLDSGIVMNMVKKQDRINQKEYVDFPLCNRGITEGTGIEKAYIGNSFTINKIEYACGIYGSTHSEIFGKNIFELFNNALFITTEVYQAEKGTSFLLKADENCVIPIMSTFYNSILEFTVNEKKHVNCKLVNDSYYYYNFQKNDMISVKSEHPFYMGTPLNLTHHKNNKKLVLALFVDGLPQSEFNKENMPETYKKFSSGVIFDNAFSNGEWTLPSIASIFTGKDTMHHRIYHPDYSSDNLKKFETYTKILQDHGYLCTMIGGDWRITPVFGYMKNMDRCIYKMAAYDVSEPKLINDLIEHLEAFGEADNFVWLSLGHLHEIPDELELPLSCQVKMPLESRIEEKTEGISVHRKYSVVKRERLKYAMRHLDSLLHQLYMYLDSKYGDDYVISLFSDHGQGYLIPEGGDFLDIQRSNTAMMISGNENIGICDELVQTVDLFPALLSRINIQDTLLDVQGKIPSILGGDDERQYSYTESLFPEAPYYLSIFDKKYKYFFHTENAATAEGMIDISQYQYHLVDRKTNQDVTLENQELADYYTDITFQHIKEFITD